MTPSLLTHALSGALCLFALASVSAAQPMAGGYGGYGPAPAPADGRQCWAQVREPARFAPPPTGPEYVWTQAPAPPGAPGPVWCLTVRPMPGGPVLVAPERLGWIRVLCADDVTPARVEAVQRGLYARGFYRGGFDGRYDERTASAVADFQRARNIPHRGYLSYATYDALQAPPPPRVVYLRRPTTFDRGYVVWPGESRYW